MMVSWVCIYRGVHSHISPNNIVDAFMLALIRIQYVHMSIQCKLQNTIECNVM